MLERIGEIFRLGEGGIYFIFLILLLSPVSFVIWKHDISELGEPNEFVISHRTLIINIYYSFFVITFIKNLFIDTIYPLPINRKWNSNINYLFMSFSSIKVVAMDF